MYEELKKRVFDANMMLVKLDLVILTWGNVSEFDRKNGLIGIKPSGLDYDKMKYTDIVIVDIDGNIIEGELKPSSDLDTHLEIYRHFENANGVCHTHSTYATSFAQSGKKVKAYGTTHADYFYGPVPVSRKMKESEIKENYELNTGKVIVETFNDISHDEIPAVLVNMHGPFTWGKSADKAVENSYVLEKICEMNIHTLNLNNKISSMDSCLLDKHYLRKHGKDAYYGQK